MFFENKMKSKIGLMISNVVFILILIFQFISGQQVDDTTQIFQTETTIITVYITGEVNHPNLYEIESNKRLNDLILLAGGLTEEADYNAINLALTLKDEMKIVIPNKQLMNETNNGKININTAPISELVKLNGIGEAKANAIIQYREQHGPFTNIVQIMKVYGIGDATYDKIKDDICI